jgi:hypothetical protein
MSSRIYGTPKFRMRAMSHKVNYGDNIFFLNMKVKILKNCLKLDIDWELFLEKINEEILFVVVAIEKLYGLLKESPFIVNRSENLKAIQRLKVQIIGLLSSIIDGEGKYSGLLENRISQYNTVRKNFLHNIEEIKNIITGINEKAVEEQYIISEEEYKHLLANDE